MHPVLQSCFLFNGVPVQDLAAVAAALPPETPFVKGQPVCPPAQRGVTLLLSGRARAVYRDADGGEHLLKFLLPGQIFGALTLFEQPAHTSCVIAEQNGAAQFIPEEVLLALWQRYPQTAQNYIRFLTQRVRFLNRRISALSGSTVYDRLWTYLLQNCRSDGTVVLDRSITALSATLGIGRASLYRCLGQMERRGQLRRDSHYIIIERAYLE